MPNSNTIDWFEIAKFISEIVLSALTVAISLFALYQTKRQIKLSNKHQLFDRRLENYNIVVDLISCFYTAVLICDDESNIDEYSTIILQALLDNSYYASPSTAKSRFGYTSSANTIPPFHCCR